MCAYVRVRACMLMRMCVFPSFTVTASLSLCACAQHLLYESNSAGDFVRGSYVPTRWSLNASESFVAYMFQRVGAYENQIIRDSSIPMRQKLCVRTYESQNL